MDPTNSWHEEMQSAWLYRALAASESEPRLSDLFSQLSTQAASQADHWEALIRAAGRTLPTFRPSHRAMLVAWLARRLGPRAIRPILAAMKIRGLSAYNAWRVQPVDGHPLPTHTTQIGRRHRQGGGNLRAAIFGINDGLVSNASLILGMVGAQAGAASVMTTGIAGWLAGALSMAAGEFVSVRSQREMFEYQIALESDELKTYPEAEAEELALIYASRGMPLEQARTFARTLVQDPTQALDVLAREELGLNPADLGSPWGAAGASFAAFTIGAWVPLAPFVIGWDLPGAAYAGAFAAAVGLFVTGASLSLFTGRQAMLGGLRMLAIGGGAGALAFAIGMMISGGPAG